jgi:hypothetical protein
MISRSRFCRCALLLLWLLLPSLVFADDRAAIKASVQEFYRRYAKEQSAEKWLMKSDQVTPGLKAAYAVFMKKGPDYDPILQGQDIPESGYVAADAALEGEKAKVILRTKDKGFKPIAVYLVREKNRWLINGVNDFKGK